MATNFSDYQTTVDNFNKKYNLKFSYEAFESDVRRYENIKGNFADFGGDVKGRRYISTFSGLFRTALTNYADRRIDSFKSGEFLEDYVKMMNLYKFATSKNDPEADKDWPKPSALVNRVKKDLSDAKKGIPDTKEEYIIKRYLSRDLPIRKMREHAQQLVNSNTKDPAKFSTILAYANALEEINGKRSGLWRFFHRFRNAAEIREARNFKKMVRSALGLYKVESVDPRNKNNVKYSKDLTDEYTLAREISRDNSLLSAKEDIKNISEELKLGENTFQFSGTIKDTQKENIVMPEFSKEQDKVQDKSVSNDINKSNDQKNKEEVKNVNVKS